MRDTAAFAPTSGNLPADAYLGPTYSLHYGAHNVLFSLLMM